MAIAKRKNPAAVALGRKGGKANAKRFTAAERSEAARKPAIRGGRTPKIMLNLYRRHAKNCKHYDDGQNFTKCSCPIWCDGNLNGKRFRKSVGLRDWARTVKRIEKWQGKPQTSGAAPKQFGRKMLFGIPSA
jgi:hypothetical protein